MVCISKHPPLPSVWVIFNSVILLGTFEINQSFVKKSHSCKGWGSIAMKLDNKCKGEITSIKVAT